MDNLTWTKILADGDHIDITEDFGLTDLSIVPDTTNTTNDGTLIGQSDVQGNASEAILIQTVINLSSLKPIKGWTITAPASGKLYLIGQER